MEKEKETRRRGRKVEEKQDVKTKHLKKLKKKKNVLQIKEKTVYMCSTCVYFTV